MLSTKCALCGGIRGHIQSCDALDAWRESLQTANLSHWTIPFDSPTVEYRGKIGHFDRWGVFRQTLDAT